jgi:carbon starvation protein
MAPAKTMEQMHQIVLNNYVDAGMAALFIFLVVSILVFAVLACIRAMRSTARSDRELPFEAMPDAAHVL